MATAKIKIGHYILGETLGVGTFGKVKGEREREKQDLLLRRNPGNEKKKGKKGKKREIDKLSNLCQLHPTTWP